MSESKTGNCDWNIPENIQLPVHCEIKQNLTSFDLAAQVAGTEE